MIERFVDSFELLLYLYLGPDSCSQSSCIKTSFRVQRYKPPVINGRLQSLDSKGNVSESFRETLDLARRYVENFIEAMRAGAFPVWPRDRGACRNCNYGEICRYAEWRLRRKWEAHPIGTLVSLAEEENEETDEEDPA